VTLTTKPLGPAWDNYQFVNYTFDSVRFDIKEEIHHRALWQTLGLANELQRRPVEVNPDDHCYKPSDEAERLTHIAFGGHYDASAQNGEARAEATFVSGFCHLLESRRPELTTDQVRSLIKSIKEGASFLYLEGKDQNNNSDRILAHVDDSTDPTECDHYLHKIDPNDLSRRGHVFEEHIIRPEGHGGEKDDHTNFAKKIMLAAFAFADVARVVKPYDAAYATTHRTQAIDTRDYLYDLNEHCGFPSVDDKYVVYRSQAGLDALLAALSEPPPPPEPPDSGPAYSSSLDAAKRKVAIDLTSYDPTQTNPPNSTLVRG
jgi:hypothetical protein